MDLGPFIALGLLALVTMGCQFFFPGREKRINRMLASQPRARIRDARGAVRLTGRVRRTGDLLQAPLSGRHCVAYEVLVDEQSGGGNRGMAEWRRLVEVRQASPFVVADESGSAQVDTSGPFFLALEHHITDTTGWLGQYPGKHQALALFLESAGIVPTNWFGVWKTFRYYEGVLEEGEIISVGGFSDREVDPTGDRPDPRSPPEHVVLRGTEARPLLISDGREGRGEPKTSG